MALMRWVAAVISKASQEEYFRLNLGLNLYRYLILVA